MAKAPRNYSQICDQTGFRVFGWATWCRVAGVMSAALAGYHSKAEAVDKSRYSLANPVPAPLLREMSTDRPDVTESPFTIDAGHMQLESDFASYTHNRLDQTRTATWSLAAFNLRLGIRTDFELGIFAGPYTHDRESSPGGLRQTSAGFGDVTLRGKINFWGNDGGDSAGGAIVDVVLPTAARGLGRDRVEGTVMFPCAFKFGPWDAGAMTTLEFRQRDGDYHPVWTNTVTIGHAIAGDVSGYVELTSSVGDGENIATFDAGLAWKLNSNLQLDGGVNIGLTRDSDDVTLFAGISRRY